MDTGLAVGGWTKQLTTTMNTRSISSMDRENLLTMLRTAKQRKVVEIQASLPSIRRQVDESVNGEFFKEFGLIPLFDKVRSLRRTVLGAQKPSDSILDELESAERQMRILGFEVQGIDKVFIGSQWREHEREMVVDQQMRSRLKDERERHLKLYDDAIARVKAAKALKECREIVDSVIAA